MRIAASIVVYAVLLWTMKPLGKIGIIGALISGTTAAIILLIARQQDVVPLMRVTTYTLLGAVISDLIPIIGRNVAAQQLSQTVTYSLVGAFIAMIINLKNRTALSEPPPNSSEQDQNSP